MDLKILSALIGLCGAVSNNGKTENTDRVVLEAILSKEPEDAVRKIHEEKYKISPDCASCPAPCGNTSDGDLSRWNEAPESVRKRKEEVMASLERMAFAMAESRAKATVENLCGTQELTAPDVVSRAISWLGYVSLSDEPLDFDPIKIELAEDIGRAISEENALK